MLRIALVTVLLSGSASADPAPIADVIGEIDGREVSLTGQIGIAPMSEHYSLRTESGVFFTLELAVDRATLSKIRDCKLEIFHTDAPDCQVNIKSEIAVRGSQIDLIAFEITPITAP